MRPFELQLGKLNDGVSNKYIPNNCLIFVDIIKCEVTIVTIETNPELRILRKWELLNKVNIITRNKRI